MRWLKTEIECLKQKYNRIDKISDLCVEINKSERQIARKAYRLGLKRPRGMKKKEFDLDYIKSLIQSGLTVGSVAKKLGVHPNTIRGFCNRNNYDYLSDYGEIHNKTGWRTYEIGESGFKRLYLTYKKNAEKRNYCFNLSVEQFRSLTKADCFYCGKEPSGKFYSGGHMSKYSEYVYTGVDRKDNAIGYTLENSIPCCSMCNVMKNDFDYNQFLEKIELIYTRIIKNV